MAGEEEGVEGEAIMEVGEGVTAVEGTTTGEGEEERTADLEVVDREEEDAVEESGTIRTVEARLEVTSARTPRVGLEGRMGGTVTEEGGTSTVETIGTGTGGGTIATRATAGTTDATTATRGDHHRAKDGMLPFRWRSTLLLLRSLPPPLQPTHLPVLLPLPFPPMLPRRLPLPTASFLPPHLRHLPPKLLPLPLRPCRQHPRQHPNNPPPLPLLHSSSPSPKWLPSNPLPSHPHLSTRVSTRRGTSELGRQTSARSVPPSFSPLKNTH